MRVRGVFLFFFFVSLLWGVPLKIEQISSFGGYLENIESKNGKIFISTTDGLKIFDASNKRDIRLISKIDTLGECAGMDIVGNYIYLANLNKGLTIIDISDIKHPFVAGSSYFLDTSASTGGRAEANDVKIFGNYAYVSVGKKGIAVIDVRDVKNPKTLKYIDVQDYVKTLDIVNNYIYALCATSFKIIDLNGNILASIDLQAYGNDLKIDGNYAFIATNEGLKIIDISDSNNPSLITSYDTKGYCLKLRIKGNYLYLANGKDFVIIDISNRRDPVLINSQSKDNISCHDLALDGNYVYILNNEKPCVVDVSDPSNIVYISNFDMLSLVKKIRVKNNLIYIANDYNGIQIANASDLKNIYFLGELDLGAITNDIAIKDDTLFAAANNKGIKSIDISNPKLPRELDSLNLGGVAKSIKIDGNYAYIAAYSAGIKIVDIQNPSNLVKIGEYDLKGKANDIYIYGNYLLVADESGKFVVLDISKKDSPKYISEIALNANAYSIEVKGSYAFVADGEAGLCVIDLSDINSPVLKKCIDTDGDSRDVKIKQNFAFVADNYKGIKVIDISDIENMKITDSVSVEDKSLYLEIEGNKLFLANYSSGVKVYKVLGSPKPVLNLSADNVTKDSVSLKWDLPLAGDFDVIENIKVFRNGKFIKTLDPNSVFFKDENLQSDTKYIYEVKTSNSFSDSVGESISIKTLKLIPASVSSLKVKDLDKSFVTLEWKDNSNNEEGFIIQRDGEKIGYVNSNVTVFTDRGVKPGKKYKYTVKAFNDAGESQGVSIFVTVPNSIPIPPTSLEAIIIGKNKIKLVWEDNSDNEEGFEIYKNDKLLTTTLPNTTEYIDENVQMETLYVYTIKAFNDAGASVSDRVKVKIENTLPLPPTNFVATPLSESSIKLTWKDNSDNEDGFEIYRNDTLIYKTKENEVSFIDEGLKPDTLYKYSIRAFNKKGASVMLHTDGSTFEIDTKVPNPPIGVKAKALSSKTVKIEWSSGSDNERGYNIYRNGKLIISLGKNDFEYFDRNLLPGSEYVYEVRAFNSKGESEGTQVKVFTLKSPKSKPIAPLNFYATAVGERAVELRWIDNSDNEEGFKIYRNGKLVYFTTPNATSFLDINLEPGTLYEYEIKASNEVGDSDSLKTQAVTLNRKNIIIPPTNLFASIKNGKYVVLTWRDNSDNEKGFKIFRNKKLIYITGENETQFVDFDLKFDPNKTYLYEIRATNSNGDSVEDSVMIKPATLENSSPNIPLEFKVKKEGALLVKISWNKDKNDKNIKYKILRNGELLHIADSNESEFIDTTPLPDVEYNYSLIVVSDKGESIPIEAKIKITLNKVQKFVYNLYQTILERRADNEGLLYWSNKLEDANASALYVIKQFVKLPEFSSKNVDVQTYVKILYKTFFDREPEISGLLYWSDLIENKGYPKDIVLYKFASSLEFENICKNYGIINYTQREKAEIFIERFYQMVLGRESDEESRNFWVDALLKGKMTSKEIAKSFFDSKEFKEKNVSNEDFVKIAYRTLLDREPDSVGLSYWTKELENGLKREEFLDKFLDTKEFKKISQNGFANPI